MADQSNTNRKRPRSTSPQPSATSGSRPKAMKENSLSPSSGTTLAAQLKDPHQRNTALNELLKLSASHDLNYALDGDDVLNECVNIFYEILEWDPTLSSPVSLDATMFRSQRAWTEQTCSATAEWADHCTKKLAEMCLETDKMKTLEAILVIFRNLSFVAANIRLMAYSPHVLSVLVGSLYECTSSNNVSSGDDSTSSNNNATGNSSTLALPALHALVNLTPYLDVTGQKLLCDKLFLDPTKSDEIPLVPSGSSFGQITDGSWGFGGLWLAKRLDTKEDAVHDVSKEMVLQLSHEYLVRRWAIFPALAKVLKNSNSPRLVMMMAVDLLQEFINHARVGVVGEVDDRDTSVPNARAIVVHIPTDVLERLMDLLYVPRLGPDALDYIDPVHNIVTRVTTLKLLMGYDGTVDTDARDRALDVLVPLLELDSPRLAKRLGVKENGRPRNRLYESIVPILTTQVGRNEAPHLATQLLREVSKASENRMGLMYLQSRLIELGSRDARIAHLVMNHLYVTDDNEGGIKSNPTLH